MNALPAVAYRTPANRSLKSGKRIASSSRNRAKVINLSKRSKATLSPSEQEEMILSHRLKARSLAHSILRKWHSRLDAQEVDSVVDLSLCEAVKRYNRRKGASFITFLFYHLRGNLIRAVAAAASMNYLPLPDFEGSDSNNDGAVNKGRCLNAIEIADSFFNHDYISPDDALLKKEVAGLSSKACGNLDPLEKEVIYRIYVLEQQLMDIASNLGYSRCHISRVKRKALEALHGELRDVLDIKNKPCFDEDGEKKAPKKLLSRRKGVRLGASRSLNVTARKTKASCTFSGACEKLRLSPGRCSTRSKK